MFSVCLEKHSFFIVGKWSLLYSNAVREYYSIKTLSSKIPQPFRIIGVLSQLEAMHIFVKTSRDNTITLDVEESTTIEGLKSMLWAMEDIPPAEQRLIFAEETDLENSRRLSEYNILPGSILHLAVQVKLSWVVSESFRYSKRRRLLSELVRLELEEET